jgi:hypothetical protein
MDKTGGWGAHREHAGRDRGMAAGKTVKSEIWLPKIYKYPAVH